MHKGKVLGFRISEDLYKNLLQQAEVAGSTISDIARNIITEHARGEDLLLALQEIGKRHSQEIAQLREEMKSLTAGVAAMNRGSGGSGDIARILLIVETLGRASPSVSKQLSHLLDDALHHGR